MIVLLGSYRLLSALSRNPNRNEKYLASRLNCLRCFLFALSSSNNRPRAISVSFSDHIEGILKSLAPSYSQIELHCI